MKRDGREMHLAVVVPGNVVSEPMARVKYGQLVQELELCVAGLQTVDSTLRGVDRILNLVRSFHPRPSVWRECSYKNSKSFLSRSTRVVKQLRAGSNRPDATLQVGVLCDAAIMAPTPPLFIYTDYTAALSARAPVAGRSPFSASEREKWFELETAAYRRSRHIFCRSRLVAESLQQDYTIPKDSISVIGGGANLFPENLPQRSLEGPPTALFIGKDFYRKGGDRVIDAFERVREAVSDAKLVMVTYPPANLRTKDSHVVFVEPSVDREELSALYAGASLFVLPSRLETWGDVLLEAMAFGLPCIGVRGQPMEEIILQDETGFLVPPGDTEALAAAMMKVLEDPTVASRMGKSGRKRVTQNFSWPLVAQRLISGIQDRLVG